MPKQTIAEGFILFPVLIFTLFALLLVSFSMRSLSEHSLSQRLILYENCQQHFRQLQAFSSDASLQAYCPPCPIALGCH